MSDKTVEAEVVPPQAVIVRPEDNKLSTGFDAGQIKPPVTAAQAKIDAVANLTMKAYERAATLKLTPEESAALQADFPDSAFLPGAAGKEHLIFIEHAHLRDRFNQVFGLGQWAIVPRNRWAEEFTIPPYKDKPEVHGSRVYVEAMLVVRGCFVAEAVGAMEYYPKNNAQNYGDAVEGAKTAALRRCAKELGVGLQAWKKEWCEAWWARKRGGRDFSKKPPQTSTPPQKPPPAPAQTPAKGTVATAAFRAKMLQKLCARPGEPNCRIAKEFFEKISWLIPTESLEQLELRYVPINTEQMNNLIAAIADFEAGGDAVKPYPPNDAEEPPATANVPPIAKPPHDDEWWREIIVSVPRKGMKKADYERNPDTIGSLFDMRHGNDDESAAARQRLFGLVHNFDPKPREYNGKIYQPTAADLKCREALDAFWEFFEKNHPGEKL